MAYVPHTPADVDAMLTRIGVSSLAELFATVPAEVRFPPIDLPGPQSELETLQELQALAERNNLNTAEIDDVIQTASRNWRASWGPSRWSNGWRCRGTAAAICCASAT